MIYQRNRVVIFAGVFDPVHKGHISAAKAALTYGSQVVFIPERVPQHKHGTASFEHRLKMIEIATKEIPNMGVVDYPEDHHTVEATFRWLKLQFPDKEFVWLVGNDVVTSIEKWNGSQSLHKLGVVLVAVIKRQGDQGLDVKYIHSVPVEHSIRAHKLHEKLTSSSIREDIQHQYMSLPEGVYEYITKYNLYK